MIKFRLLAFVVFCSFLIQSCSENSVDSDKTESPSSVTSIKGKFIRVGDNKRAGIEGVFDLVSDIEFRNEHCHFTYVTTKMSGKYSIDEGFIYIYTGGELGTLSMEIINNNQLEGEGHIHGTFKREGTFKPVEKVNEIKKSSSNSDKSSVNTQSKNPFGTEGESEDPESNEEVQVEQKMSNNPFGNGGSNVGNAFGHDGSGSGNGSASGRVRLNDPETVHIIPNEDCTISLKVTINEFGEVVSVANMTSKTTTTDQRIINQVMVAVKKDVRYSKAPGSPLVNQYITIRLYAN